MVNKLIFVYNADSGYFNMVTDIAHKIFSPSTYACSLCGVTHGVFKIHAEWDDFVKHSPVPFAFLHKDEFLKQYPALGHIALPVVFANSASDRNILMDKASLGRIQSIEALKNTLLEKLSSFV